MRSLFSLLLALSLPGAVAHAQGVQLVDAYPDRARYAPSDPVKLIVELDGNPKGDERISASIWQLGQPAGQCEPVALRPESPREQKLTCTLPTQDYQGYLATVRLTDVEGRILCERQTAIDISSDWKRFPRYGYLAHYDVSEGTNPRTWIAELNRFHINGLEFYDFQYRH